MICNVLGVIVLTLGIFAIGIALAGLNGPD